MAGVGGAVELFLAAVVYLFQWLEMTGWKSRKGPCSVNKTAMIGRSRVGLSSLSHQIRRLAFVRMGLHRRHAHFLTLVSVVHTKDPADGVRLTQLNFPISMFYCLYFFHILLGLHYCT